MCLCCSWDDVFTSKPWVPLIIDAEVGGHESSSVALWIEEEATLSWGCYTGEHLNPRTRCGGHFNSAGAEFSIKISFHARLKNGANLCWRAQGGGNLTVIGSSCTCQAPFSLHLSCGDDSPFTLHTFNQPVNPKLQKVFPWAEKVIIKSKSYVGQGTDLKIQSVLSAKKVSIFF